MTFTYAVRRLAMPKSTETGREKHKKNRWERRERKRLRKNQRKRVRSAYF